MTKTSNKMAIIYDAQTWPGFIQLYVPFMPKENEWAWELKNEFRNVSERLVRAVLDHTNPVILLTEGWRCSWSKAGAPDEMTDFNQMRVYILETNWLRI